MNEFWVGRPRGFHTRSAWRAMTQEERLWAFIDKPDDPEACWLWQGAPTRRGYGRANWDGQRMQAHRAVYLMLVGPVSDGLHILHRCDNPSCVRPDHLFPGTHADNMADMIAKGRHHMRTHCRRGHEYPAVAPTETRSCPECRRESNHRSYLNRRARGSADWTVRLDFDLDQMSVRSAE